MQAVQRKTAYEVQSAPPNRKRVVKIEGNVAYIGNDFATEIARRPVSVPKAQPRAKAIPRKAEQPKKGLASTLIVLFVAFCAMAVLVSRYAVASSMGRQNVELETNIASVENQIDALQVDIELKDDLMVVQQTAQQELGMTYPDPEQVIETQPGG